MFLEISQNSQENTCAGLSFLSLRPATLLKKRIRHRCFPVNFVKFLGIPFLQNISGRLLLYFLVSFDVSFKVIDFKKLLQFSRLSIYTSLKGLIIVSKENHNKAPITTIFPESRL